MSWIVVASRAQARIFQWNAHAAELHLLADIDNSEGRLKSGELESDRPGMAFRAQGRHPMSTKHPAHEQAAERFASALAERLKAARVQNEVASLVLVAEPHFMGLLRAELDAPTAALVTKTIAKDLAGLTVADTSTRLREALRAL